MGPMIWAARLCWALWWGGAAAALTGRLGKGEPLQAEALAAVFLTAGAALWLEVSYLLAGMVAGAVVANFAPQHRFAFHEIKRVEWPFMLLFFLLAGASFQPEALRGLELLVLAYVVLRVVSRVGAGWLGARLSGLGAAERAWLGAALMPQAGVAVGLALVAAARFEEHGQVILSVTIATTIVFELLGPILTLTALKRTGSIPTGAGRG